MAFKITGFTYRQGTAYSRGTSIDPLLPDATVAKIYEKWLPSWPEPNEFHGGLKDITCEMILEIPEAELRKVFGKSMAAELVSVATAHAGR